MNQALRHVDAVPLQPLEVMERVLAQGLAPSLVPPVVRRPGGLGWCPWRAWACVRTWYRQWGRVTAANALGRVALELDVRPGSEGGDAVTLKRTVAVTASRFPADGMDDVRDLREAVARLNHVVLLFEGAVEAAEPPAAESSGAP